MANISLRGYYREVEELIGQGRIDEVIAHCRQMLRFFPKDVTVYRLLAKTYLETQRFSDATDIFQRVLSVVPEDFVSHVGMSIIREDEGNLDAAIWHMERAFEVQPSNSAIRDELRRLFGKRDGMEPPKIRLSRGALARMYAQGNLYQQSIGELRAAMADEPNRFDLQSLLAQMYFLNGNKVEAAEICSSLLNKLPFCLEGNKILAQILVESGRAEEADTYHQRVQTLDPYAAHVSPANPDTSSVPDNAISLVRLDYDPGEAASATDSRPDWAASLGISLEDEKQQKSELPSWLAEEESGDIAEDLEEAPAQMDTPEEVAQAVPMDEESDMPTSPYFNQEVTDSDMDSKDMLPPDEESEEEAAQEPDDLVPDWMQDAGWAVTDSDAPAEDELPHTDELDYSALPVDEPAGEGQIEAGEIPDWLQDMAPPEVKDAAATVEEDDQMSGEIPPWLGSRPPGPTDSVVMWLKNKPEDESEVPHTGPLDDSEGEELESVDVPDWLKSVAAKMPVAEAADSGQEPEPADSPQEDEGAEPAMAQEQDPHPDWLGQPTGEAEDSAASIEDTQPTRKAREESAPPDETAFELPAAAQFEPASEPSVETPLPSEMMEPSTAEEQLEWGGPADEDVAEAAMPEAEMDSGVETPGEAEEPEPAAEEVPEWLGAAGDEEAEVGTPVADVGGEEDEIPDWLHELEAEVPSVETGPLEEIAMRPADAPQVELPEWLTDAAPDEDLTTGQPDLAPGEPEVEVPGAEADWLRPAQPAAEAPVDEPMEAAPPWLEPEPTPDEMAPEPAMEEQLPAWMAQEPAEEPPQEPAVPTELETDIQPGEADELPSLEDQDAAIAWLESLAAKQGAAEEELITSPEERREAPPEWVAESMDEEVETVSESIEESLPEQPDWMTETMMSETLVPGQEEEAEPWAAETMEGETAEEEIPEWVLDTNQTKDEEAEAETELEEMAPADSQPLQTRELSQDWMFETGLPDEFFTEEESAEHVEAAAETEPPPWAPVTAAADETQQMEPQEAIEEPAMESELPPWVQETAAAEEAQPVVSEEADLESEMPPWAQETAAAEEAQPVASEEADLEPELPPWAQETAAPDEPQEMEPEEAMQEPAVESETPIWARDTIEYGEESPEQPPAETLPSPAVTKELEADWKLETELPEDLFDAGDEVDKPGEMIQEEATPVQEAPPEFEETLAEAPPESVEAAPEETRELDSEWLLETALPDSLFDQAEPEEADVMPELQDLVEQPDAAELMTAETEVPFEEEMEEAIPSEEPVAADRMAEAQAWQEPAAAEPTIEAAPPTEVEAEVVSVEPELEDVRIPAEPWVAAPEEAIPEVAMEIPSGDARSIVDDLIHLGQAAISEGNIEEALQHYNKLIRKRKNLELVIENLKDAVYRFPVDTNVLESLGDAYARSNKLQDALDSYTKAEELLR